MTNIITIVGARPQFIKAAPVCKALKEFGLVEALVHTGQHYDKVMSDVFFDQLGIPAPVVNFGVGSGSHAVQTAKMMIKLDALFAENRPDAVLVYGDTNSTLAGSLTASKLGIPVIHIEAGLRSFNKNMPEEQNRVLTDHISDFLFCPTQRAIDNLRKENVTGQIHIVGDTMKDAVDMFTPVALATSDILQQLGLNGQKFVLATIHRHYNTDNQVKLKELFEAFSNINRKIIVPAHPRLQSKINRHTVKLPNNLVLTEPVSYFDMLVLQRNAEVIVTDSGGLQKEAYFHKKPCVTLRPETEWIETVDVGCNRLAWDSVENMVTAIEGALMEPAVSYPQLFGDGNAAAAVAKIINDSF